MAASCIVDAGVQLVLEEMMKGVASEGGGGRRRRRRRRKAETENKRHARTSNKGVIGFLPTLLSSYSYSPFHLPLRRQRRPRRNFWTLACYTHSSSSSPQLLSLGSALIYIHHHRHSSSSSSSSSSNNNNKKKQCNSQGQIKRKGTGKIRRPLTTTKQPNNHFTKAQEDGGIIIVAVSALTTQLSSNIIRSRIDFYIFHQRLVSRLFFLLVMYCAVQCSEYSDIDIYITYA